MCLQELGDYKLSHFSSPLSSLQVRNTPNKAGTSSELVLALRIVLRKKQHLPVVENRNSANSPLSEEEGLEDSII